MQATPKTNWPTNWPAPEWRLSKSKVLLNWGRNHGQPKAHLDI
jgi:hypothetical protein